MATYPDPSYFPSKNDNLTPITLSTDLTLAVAAFERRYFIQIQAGLVVTLKLRALSTSQYQTTILEKPVTHGLPSHTPSIEIGSVALFQIHSSSLKIVPTSVTTKTASWSEMSIQPENTRIFPTPQAQVQAPLADP